MLEFLGSLAALLVLLFYGFYRLFRNYPPEAKARLRSVGFPTGDTDVKAQRFLRLCKICAALSAASFVAEYLSTKF